MTNTELQAWSQRKVLALVARLVELWRQGVRL